MSKLIIGLHGRRESGKDTVAGYLSEYLTSLKLGVTQDRFASTIYQMASQLDPVFSPDMPHTAKADYVLGDPKLGTRRNFLEKLGTEFGRDMIYSRIWTEALMNRVARTPDSVVICDVRTDEEQEAILEVNGCILHLEPDWPASESDTSHHFTQSVLTIRDPRRETVLALKSGQFEATREMAIASVDSWCANGVGLYMGQRHS